MPYVSTKDDKMKRSLFFKCIMLNNLEINNLLISIIYTLVKEKDTHFQGNAKYFRI